jgi:hypothetical protein
VLVENVGEVEEGQWLFNVEDLVDEGHDNAAVVGQVVLAVLELHVEWSLEQVISIEWVSKCWFIPFLCLVGFL